MAHVIPHPTYSQYRQKVGVMPDFSGSKSIQQEEPMGTKDGTNQNFTLYNTPIPASEMIFRDGMYLRRGVNYDYTLNAKTITFNEAPPSNAVILVNYRTMDQ